MYFDAIRYEFEFSTGVWTDVSDYVIGTDKGQMGIRGWGPLDRVAGTGSFTFSLRNVNNMFTPGHINCMEGFETGVKVRLVIELYDISWIRFIGRVPPEGLDVDTSPFFSVTTVTVVDYMEQLAIHELDLPAFAENKRIDEIIPLIIANMPIAPDETDYKTGQDTFSTVFDSASVRTRALQELAKVAVSEMGFVYIKHGTVDQDKILVYGAGENEVNGLYHYYDVNIYRKTASGGAYHDLYRNMDGGWRISFFDLPDEYIIYRSTAKGLDSPFDVTEWVFATSASPAPLLHGLDPNNVYQIQISGAGTDEVNGVYDLTGVDRYNKYVNTNRYARLHREIGGEWTLRLYDLAPIPILYQSTNTDADSPFDVDGWTVLWGDPPAPSSLSVYGVGREVLTVEGRQSRFGASLALGPSIFEDCFYDHELAFGKHYYNHIKTRAYPRRVDSAATTVLFTLEKPIAVAAGATETIKGSFRDPDQEAVSVAGIDMVTPVATTDYQLNAAEDGSGTDLTANLSVTATYGVNGVEYELENTGATLGYVIHLQARGKGVYTYRPVEYEDEYAAGINADGKHTLNLNLAYQDNPLVAKDFAGVFLDLYASKRLVVDSVTMVANANRDLLDTFVKRQIGDKIQILIGSAMVDGAYHIHSIDFTISSPGIVNFTFGLFPASLAPSESYWLIGDAGYSEIGETTMMGF